jgi:signal transduction histidine kinase
MKRRAFVRCAPPWWPAGEPWPPQSRSRGRGHARARFFRRVAAALAALFLLALIGMFWAVRMAADRLGVARPHNAITVLFVLFGAAVVLRGMFSGMRRFASPLGAVMEAADRVAEGDYSVRVEEYGPPPIRALGRSFNTMTDRLQRADRLRRDLMADIAHELRTPLSVLQGRLEGLRDGVYERDASQIAQLLEETHVLSRLVEDLRTLSLTESGALQLHRERTDIVGLVQDTLRSMHEEADRKAIALGTNADEDETVVELDPVRIREVVTNLVSNALRHTPAGGAVNVSIGHTESSVAVTVSDTGEGMSAEEVNRIFDRFYKGPTSRGSGLGLTIAKAIIIAHAGDITATSEAGKGTAVTFRLPSSRPGQ